MQFNTVAEAAEALAALSICREKSALEKSAVPGAMGTGAGFGAANPTLYHQIMGHAQNAWESNSPLVGALGGGLAGAGIGGIGTALMNMGRDEREKRSPWHGALMGGLAGGGLGLGAGVMSQQSRDKPPAPLVPPDVAEANSRLRSPSPGRQALGFIGRNAPISTAAVPAAIGADVALNSDRLRLGERGVPFGRIRPSMSANPEDLVAGVGASAKPAEGGMAPELRAAIRGGVPGTADRLAAGVRSGQPSDVVLGPMPGGTGATLTRDAQRIATGQGFRANNPAATGLRRTLFGGQKPITGGGGWVPRAAYMLGIPALEYLLHQQLQQSADQNTVSSHANQQGLTPPPTPWFRHETPPWAEPWRHNP